MVLSSSAPLEFGYVIYNNTLLLGDGVISVQVYCSLLAVVQGFWLGKGQEWIDIMGTSLRIAAARDYRNSRVWVQ